MSKPIEHEVILKCKTEGFDEAHAQIEALAEVYDGFPAQVVIKNCDYCNIHIYPSQVKVKGEKE